MIKVACLAFVTVGFATVAQAVAQDTSVKLSPTREIRKGITAWPQILSPKNDAERRINGYLADLNTQLTHSLRECDVNYEQTFGKHHKLHGDDEGTEFWTQNIKVTMLGPAFLSLVANTDFYCGEVHPYGFTDVAVFDLRTGQPADQVKWFLPTVNLSLVDEDEQAPGLDRLISVPGLVEAYRAATRHECDDTYSNDQPFLIWPDAKSGKVMMQADRLPGCCEACGIETGLTLDEARKLGFSESFLQAVNEAQRAGKRP
jgi:hypothetical protein